MIAEEHYVSSELLPHTKEVIKAARPHQQDALAALYNAAQAYDRYTCVMACGTGKTLVGLWHAEQLQARKILVLLPSLGLINQTLHEWLKNTRLSSLEYLCVCSDSTIGSRDEDLLQYQPEELDFRITTQPTQVTKFLSACAQENSIVIFSTYHSAKVVGEGAGRNFSFDLVIFDEAHKTAGEAGKAFSYALYDKHIMARKRLFMTATPRVLNPYKKSHYQQSELDLYFTSMDNQKIYGPTAYSLNFRKAVNLNIIVDYKIVISVVTSETVQKVLHKAQLKFNNKKINAVQIAHLLAIQHAVQEHNIKKLITFHSRVKIANFFQKIIDQNWFDVLEDFNAQHISGLMPASKRERSIRTFKNSKNGILTNARCLTEGIDVPVVDMIAFLCNKKSRIDIVQAAGRVMRRAPEKKVGYILIPFYIHTDKTDVNTIEDSISFSDYSDIFYILKTLADYDDSLKDIVNFTYQEKNKSGEINNLVLEKKLLIIGSDDLNIDILKKSISTMTLSAFNSGWIHYYALLNKFKNKYGHSNVSVYNKPYTKLGRWVSIQRKRYWSGDLKQEYIDKLNALDFVWRHFDAVWHEYFEKLKKLKDETGSCKVHYTDRESKKLGAWTANQRKKYKLGKLKQEYIDQLNSIDFIWETKEFLWESKYKKLIAYKNENGHCNVPCHYKKDPSLGRWVSLQRDKYKKGGMSKSEIERLNLIGFVWDLHDVEWYRRFEELKLFKIKNGHFNVPSNYKQYPGLRGWLTRQRKNYENNSLEQKYMDQLNSLNFNWEVEDIFWSKRFEELKSIKDKTGSCVVSYTTEENKRLGAWTAHQRKSYKSGKLKQEYIDQLNAIGFIWKTNESAWDKQFHKLIKYKKENGHCDVPFNYDDYTFARWVSTQRVKYRKGKLSKRRIYKLNELDFRWNKHVASLNKKNHADGLWNRHYEILKKFNLKHGHCDVLKKHTDDKKLLQWIKAQKHLYKKGELSPERIKKLIKLGFKFDNFSEMSWEIRIKQLNEFKNKLGHCDVVKKYTGDKSLLQWARNQRFLHKQGKLTKDRFEKLKELGFFI